MKKVLTLLVAAMSMTFSAIAAEPSDAYYHNASITIRNKSDYTITVKIMREEGGLYTTRSLSPHSSSCVSFSGSGNFYTKTKAEKGLETLYKKGSSFSVYCGSDGYTEGTLEFYVSGYGSTGQSISKAEFEKNY